MNLESDCESVVPPCQDGLQAAKKATGVRSCCCSWGPACKDFCNAIECLPAGSAYDLWKQAYAQIWDGTTPKKSMHVKVLHHHLGVYLDVKEKPPAKYSVAPHHWPIELLQWRSRMKKCQWTNPLTKEDADRFGTSCDKIDCHPKSSNKETLFFQTPNMPKYQLSLLIQLWSSKQGLRESHRSHRQVTTGATVAPPVVATTMSPLQL